MTLLFSLLAANVAFSQLSSPQTLSDPQGNLYQVWVEGGKLKLARSLDRGVTFTAVTTLYAFPEEINSFDLKIKDSLSYYLIYETKKKEIFYNTPADGGQSFKVDSDSFSPKLAVSSDLISLVWGKPQALHHIQSANQGFSWSKPEIIPITGEALISLAITIDDYQQTHFLFSTRNLNSKVNRIYHNDKLLAESFQDFENPQIKTNSNGLFISWQKEGEQLLMASLDFGKTFSQIDPKNPPATPTLLRPTHKAQLNTSSPTLELTAQGGGALLYKIELSADKNFPTDKSWGLNYLNSSGSAMVAYQVPLSLPDGTYYVRTFSFNGINQSLPSNTIEFVIDTTPPVITFSPTIENEVKESEELLIQGETNEKESTLSLNGQELILQPPGKFSANFKLKPGENTLNFKVTDKAGNVFTQSYKVTYTPENVKITIRKPSEKDWFKADSTILVEARVEDLKGEIKDESEADVLLLGKALETNLAYDKEEGNISGFITLPENLADGSFPAKLKIADKEKSFVLNIDSRPPIITSNTSYSNSPSKIKLPILDNGIGVDPHSTLIKIGDKVFTGEISSEAAQEIVLKTEPPLTEGAYKIEVIPRDLIGNLGESSIISLVVDTQVPHLTILSNVDKQTKEDRITLSGKVEDAYPKNIKVYINQKLVKEFDLKGGDFTKEVRLFPGANEILVEAYDAAGNKDRQIFNTFSTAVASNALVSSFANGPNPFNPKNENANIIYTLSQSSDLKIYVFDLSGTLLWKREFTNASSGSTGWDGRDQFGSLVENGVYPYIITATSGGSTEIKRGKIIALQ